MCSGGTNTGKRGQCQDTGLEKGELGVGGEWGGERGVEKQKETVVT